MVDSGHLMPLPRVRFSRLCARLQAVVEAANPAVTFLDEV